MTTDDTISELEREVIRLKSECDTLQAAVLDAAAGWRSTTWQELVRGAIEADPENATADLDNLAGLKQRLSDVESQARDRAAELFSGCFSHDDLGPGAGQREKVWSQASIEFKDCFENHARRLIGEVEAVVSEARVPIGLRMIHGGVWRAQLRYDQLLNEQLVAYTTALKGLTAKLGELEQARQSKAGADATAIWDDL